MVELVAKSFVIYLFHANTIRTSIDELRFALHAQRSTQVKLSEARVIIMLLNPLSILSSFRPSICKRLCSSALSFFLCSLLDQWHRLEVDTRTLCWLSSINSAIAPYYFGHVRSIDIAHRVHTCEMCRQVFLGIFILAELISADKNTYKCESYRIAVSHVDIVYSPCSHDDSMNH